MGSATRSALAAARDQLAATSGVDLTAGDQLLAAGRTIGSSSQLRGALMDPSSTAAAKAGLVGALFSSLVPASRSLLDAIVASRWSSGDELLAGIEEIGIRAVAASAPASTPVANELFAFGRAVSSDAQLELAISSKRGALEGKRALVQALLGTAGSPHAVAIMGHLVQQPRGRRVGELVRTGAAIVADAAGKGVATISVATPLSDAQRVDIEKSLAARYGREHVLNQVIDPALIGGVRVQVGDEVIDGSVAARLTDLKLRLAG